MFKSAEIMMLRQIHQAPELDPERVVGSAQAQRKTLKDPALFTTDSVI